MAYNQNFFLMFFGGLAIFVVLVLIYVFLTFRKNIGIMQKSVGKQLPDLSETEEPVFNLKQQKKINKVATLNDEDKVLSQIKGNNSQSEETFEEMQEYIDSKSLAKKRAKKELPTLESSVKKMDFSFNREG